jgi:hypothetical protein
LLDPAIDGGVVYFEASLGHHLLQIPIAEAVTQIPAHAQQDNLAFEVTPLERAV